MSAIQITDFVKDYGPVRVLKGVSLAIQEGEFVVLLGPSGCGKSTLLRMVAGLEAITDGLLQIAGAPMNEVPASERNIAMVFQSYALYPHMTVFDNIAFGLRRLKTPEPEIRRRVDEVAQVLALGELLARRPRQLSGGQQQRVAMARAMIKTPKVFLFDEPLSNLDAKLRDHLRTEIKKLHRLLKTTTVFVTHDQLEAMTLADRIVVMDKGAIEQQGSPREVYFEPASLFVARFIGSPAINLLPMTVTATSAGRIELDGPCGPLSLLAAAYLPMQAGQQVVTGIRPKDFRRAPADDAPAWQATVELIEMMGAETLMSLRVGTSELQWLVDDRDALEPGSGVRIAPQPDAVHVFDASTERSLRRPASRPGPAA